ncbi:response regulator transcription factor [Pontibacillus yanchengensis]|uniref:PhoP family transcriptional regulator n=1 Tax=Pontibacillus yanchengensis Y32 TaxID=1385514 RepID=A0A0A2TE97_9BACI|nr:response regulator transcription factor [Pontibacillus yanchengensis]KGP72391.1 PhoP family transcriptional regulator [Pontibacillus yanchengensis Y32]
MKQTILVAEDDENIVDVCRRYLEKEGYEVLIARDGHEAINRWKNDKPDLVILDIMMPLKNGLDIAEEIRFDDDIPVMLLTALGQEKDRLFGLSIGVDDYITKPFSPREMVLRVKNVLRRYEKSGKHRDTAFSFGQYRIDYNMRSLTKNGVPIEMTVKEFDLLWFLVQHESQVFSRSQLLEKLWGYEFEGDTNTINVHIRKLREKLEQDPAHPTLIKTVWGIGYKFEGKATP